MIKATKPGQEIAAFLICDHRALRKYGLGCVPSFPMPIGRHLSSGYLMRGDTLAALAAKAGIDARGLETTVAQFNATATSGQDPAFGKGSRAYNRFQGDALHGPNPCIAPIAGVPSFAYDERGRLQGCGRDLEVGELRFEHCRAVNGGVRAGYVG